jgi:hypothetical protein
MTDGARQLIQVARIWRRPDGNRGTLAANAKTRHLAMARWLPSSQLAEGTIYPECRILPDSAICGLDSAGATQKKPAPDSCDTHA